MVTWSESNHGVCNFSFNPLNLRFFWRGERVPFRGNYQATIICGITSGGDFLNSRIHF